MARPTHQEEIQKLYREIRDHPGNRKGFIASLLGWHRQKVERYLIYANDEGFLLTEDSRGNLSVYEKGKSP